MTDIFSLTESGIQEKTIWYLIQPKTLVILRWIRHKFCLSGDPSLIEKTIILLTLLCDNSHYTVICLWCRIGECSIQAVGSVSESGIRTGPLKEKSLSAQETVDLKGREIGKVTRYLENCIKLLVTGAYFHVDRVRKRGNLKLWRVLKLELWFRNWLWRGWHIC